MPAMLRLSSSVLCPMLGTSPLVMIAAYGPPIGPNPAPKTPISMLRLRVRRNRLRSRNLLSRSEDRRDQAVLMDVDIDQCRSHDVARHLRHGPT